MSSLKRALVRLLVVVVVLGLGGAVAVLLSRLNAKTFTVEDQGGSLTVMKGREFPIGADPFRPPDPTLADTYAPFPMDGVPVDPALLQQKFTDRDELDRALFDVLQRLAGPRVASDDPAALDRGLYFIGRAEKLSGVSPDQRMLLSRMKADVSFYLGRVKLDVARKTVAEALVQLHLAADSQNKHSRSASQMLLAVEPSAKALEEGLRQAVNVLSTPPPNSPNTPTPPPAPPAAPTPSNPAPPAAEGDKPAEAKAAPAAPSSATP